MEKNPVYVVFVRHDGIGETYPCFDCPDHHENELARYYLELGWEVVEIRKITYTGRFSKIVDIVWKP